jgi:hypothetical protein
VSVACAVILGIEGQVERIPRNFTRHANNHAPQPTCLIEVNVTATRHRALGRLRQRLVGAVSGRGWRPANPHSPLELRPVEERPRHPRRNEPGRSRRLCELPNTSGDESDGAGEFDSRE